MKGIKLKVSRCIFLQPKNERVLQVIQLGNVEPGDYSPWMRKKLLCERLNYFQLGEGKLRAFSDADHKALRDLKDKWNTLVHAARIPPEQRKGEPIPQEHFDRVLTAHILG
ncbi:hypothetical protein DEO72_LG11g8 [Vigna unguiculata]|uniref:Uncharacterized protein n=1 Tax=Vigna unguiculata TaxID=3917 RepID=A0A4D6NMA2_VIGUN|nr:hypothetical protein DEO72_LG11g8 [Vigna unguiculata]